MSPPAPVPAEVIDLAESFGFRDHIQAVFHLTQEMFPGHVAVDVESDPEWPEDKYLVFNVESSAAPAEAVVQEADWHRKVAMLVPDRSDHICLSNMPRS